MNKQWKIKRQKIGDVWVVSKHDKMSSHSLNFSEEEWNKLIKGEYDVKKEER